MRRISRIVVIALAVILLVQQSVSFGTGQFYGVTSAASTLVADQHQTPASENGNRDAAPYCGHGCHLQNHFLGNIAHVASALFVPMQATELMLPLLDRWVTATIEPPYRPPRFSPLA